MMSTSLSILFLASAALMSGACPTPTVSYSWPNYQLFYYDWPTPGAQPGAYTAIYVTNIGIDTDISSAFSKWNYANTNNNVTATTFSHVSGANFRVYAVTVNYPGIPGWGDPQKAAETLMGVSGGTGDIVLATTTFFYNSYSSSSGYTVLDGSAPNHHAFIEAAMLHEIGHTMGLYDQTAPFTSGESVMNGQSGTNDIGGILPSNVTYCDNSSAH